MQRDRLEELYAEIDKRIERDREKKRKKVEDDGRFYIVEDAEGVREFGEQLENQTDSQPDASVRTPRENSADVQQYIRRDGRKGEILAQEATGGDDCDSEGKCSLDDFKITEKYASAVLEEFKLECVIEEKGLTKDVIRSLKLIQELDHQCKLLKYLMEEPFAMWMTGHASKTIISQKMGKEKYREEKYGLWKNQDLIDSAFGRNGSEATASEDEYEGSLSYHRGENVVERVGGDLIREQLDEVIDIAEKVTKDIACAGKRPTTKEPKDIRQKQAEEDLTLEQVKKALFHIHRRLLTLSLRKKEISKNVPMLDRVTNACIRLKKATMPLISELDPVEPNINPLAELGSDVEDIMDEESLIQIYSLYPKIMKDKLIYDFLDDDEKFNLKKLREITENPGDLMLKLSAMGNNKKEPDSPKTVLKRLRCTYLSGLYDNQFSEIPKDTINTSYARSRDFEKVSGSANYHNESFLDKRCYIDGSQFSPERTLEENFIQRKQCLAEESGDIKKTNMSVDGVSARRGGGGGGGGERGKRTEVLTDPILADVVLSYQPVMLNAEGRMFLDLVQTPYGKMISPPKGYLHSAPSPQVQGKIMTKDEISAGIIGLSAEIYWPDDGLWYFVHINSVDEEKGQASIIYTTGETELLDLNEIVTEGHMSIIN